MKKANKSFFANYRFYICILITVLLLSLFVYFPNSFYRFYVSAKDFLISVVYYFQKLFFINSDLKVTVTDLVTYPTTPVPTPVTPPVVIPKTYNLFVIKLSMFFHSLINMETLAKFLAACLNQFAIFVRWFLIFLPLLLVVYLLHRRLFKLKDKKLGSDSRNLTKAKRFNAKVIDPIRYFFSDLFYYIFSYRFIYIIWIVILCFYFNFFSIALDFLAYYFYFIVSFDIKNLYIQFYKLFLDLKPMFEFVPGFVWFLIFVFVFDRMRKAHGYNVLNHHELMNRGFINSLGQSTFIVGTPGTGKTTALTDMSLSQEVMFRDKALELMNKAYVEFPNFPFIKLEKALQKEYEEGNIFNLASSAKYARNLTKAFSLFYHNQNIKDCRKVLFDYDFETYGLEYDDGTKIIDFLSLKDAPSSVLEIYCKLYFIYVCQSSLIVSNYGIRSDFSFMDQGNLPLWDYEFFKTSSASANDNRYSSISHILDWDTVRIGKKMIKNNKNSNAFEFGIVSITEIGKERGNQYDTKGLKKSDKETNQINDQFNNFLKLIRHSATVDNFPFIKIIFDEQRAESLGADGRELCEKVINIKEKSDAKNPLWLFRLESIFFDFATSKFTNFHNRFRFYRSDNILYSHLIDFIYSKIYHHYINLFNTFGYSIQMIDLESSKLDSNFETAKYFLSYKKIYSYRFATDAFADYFYRKSNTSNIGLNSISSFKTYRASLEELLSENSYLFNSLLSPIMMSQQPKEKGDLRRASRSPFPADHIESSERDDSS